MKSGNSLKATKESESCFTAGEGRTEPGLCLMRLRWARGDTLLRGHTGTLRGNGELRTDGNYVTVVATDRKA